MAFFNDESSRVKKNHDIELSSQSSLISWNDSLQALCYEGSKQYYNDSYVVNALYRPFTKQFLYFQREWIQRPYQMPRLFPATMTNIAIGISGIGHQKTSLIHTHPKEL